MSAWKALNFNDKREFIFYLSSLPTWTTTEIIKNILGSSGFNVTFKTDHFVVFSY